MTLPWVALLLALWAVVMLLCLVVVGLLRRVDPVLETAEDALRSRGAVPGVLGGLQPGARVEDFRLTTMPDGQERPFSELARGGTVVLFVQRRCPACTTLLSQLSHAPQALGAHRLLVITDEAEGAAELARAVRQRPSIRVAVQHDAEASIEELARLGVMATSHDEGRASHSRDGPRDTEVAP